MRLCAIQEGSLDGYRRLSRWAVAEFSRVADAVATNARGWGLTPGTLDEQLASGEASRFTGC